MSNRPKWISLTNIVSNNEETSIENWQTGERVINKNYRHAPMNAVATAIKECSLQVMDSLGATHLATDGDISDTNSKEYALDALDTYNHIKTHGSFIDELQLDSACLMLTNFGWLEDLLPDFATINPYYSDPSITSKNTVSIQSLPSKANPKLNTEAEIAELFDSVTVAELEKMFPASGKWKGWAERANRNGLIVARDSRAKFNPYKAAVWFLNQNITGYDLAKCNRTLSKNLPARSRGSEQLLTGEIS